MTCDRFVWAIVESSTEEEEESGGLFGSLSPLSSVRSDVSLVVLRNSYQTVGDRVVPSVAVLSGVGPVEVKDLLFFRTWC